MAGANVLELVHEEDYVEYFIFPKGFSVNDPPEVQRRALDEVASLISCTVSEYVKDYIWHKDPFNISSKESSQQESGNGPLPPHLYGITHYGDNIEDEWFIVFLLMQLSKDIEGLVVRVIDSDGEFLLIEAADYLPPGANPMTCEGRVFLFHGEVHMIPLPSEQKISSEKAVTFEAALQMIRTSPDATRANQHIQNAITSRINGYPDKIKENLHRATVFVPAGVAAVLKENPSLISPAVRAFCHRDPIDMRACRAMKYFPPENCVMASVVFTRCLYAMISHQKFTPDRRTGWTLPPISNKDYKMYNLGVKLACGFEILVSQSKPTGDCSGNRSEHKSENEENLFSSRGWSLYLDSLKRKGYFRDLLEGSKDYTMLLNKAKEFYVQNCTSVSRGMPESSSGQEVLTLLNKLEVDVEEMRKASRTLPEADEESWLEINQEELDRILVERYGPLDEKASKSNVSDPHFITATLNKFLDHVSDLDGAEFPNSQEKSNSVKVLNGPGNEASRIAVGAGSHDELMTSSMMDSSLNFDPDSFSSAVQNILDFVIPEDSWDLESDSGDSEIGSYEDESEVDLHSGNPNKEKSPETEFKQYMDQMDRELASTTIADSFVKRPSKGKSKKEKKSGSSNEEDSFGDIENFQPVDIDMNALKNILESYQSQLGAAGPASNLLGPMGVHLEALSSKHSDSKK